MTENTPHPAIDPAGDVAPDEFDKTALVGWHNFARFLFVNVAGAAIALAFVAALTVWS